MVMGLATMAQKPSAAPEKTRLLLVLDCSQSMWDKWQSDAKIKVTQKVLLGFLDSIHNQSDVEVALRVFGHLNKDDFSTRLEVPFESNNYYKLQSKLKTLVPNGGCTATTALNSSLKDFPQDNKARNIILVITDRMDNRENNVCDVAQQLQRSGNVVRTFILGIGNRKDFDLADGCVDDFTFLENEESFAEMLHNVFNISDQKARVTMTLVNENGIAFATDVPMAFYDRQTHQVKYANIYHYSPEDATDTLVLDPLITYDVAIFTKPVTRLYGKHFQGGRYTHLDVTAPQGSLRLSHKGKLGPFQIPVYSVIVRQHDSTAILASQPIDSKKDYLAGRYDIDVMSLPPIKLTNVGIISGSSTDLQIPLPGQLALSKPKYATTGSVFAYNKGSLQWVCDLNDDLNDERLVLMPGEYQVILKAKGSAEYAATRTARFTITAAKQTAVVIKN